MRLYYTLVPFWCFASPKRKFRTHPFRDRAFLLHNSNTTTVHETQSQVLVSLLDVFRWNNDLCIFQMGALEPE